jgi:alpha-glucosidase
MSTHPWWQTGVVYQVYPRSFKDSNNDGIGDLPGVIEKLDYLRDILGIDAIWLSPFYPSPMADFGYDVANYRDVDPMFGTLADFDRLVAEAHKRGLHIIIDFVPNHSSDQHPWFQESRRSRDNPKRDWYVWRDGKDGKDGIPPNNWYSVFGGSAWEYDEHTGQYYLHSFLPEQPDLNWRNPEVRAEMFDTVRFWLERGTDGIRIDVAHFIMKDPDYRDNPLVESGALMGYKSFGDYDTLVHLHDKGHLDVHGIYRDLRALMNEYDKVSPRMSVGEIHIKDWKEWAAYYGEQLDELHMPFNFSLLGVDWNAPLFRELIDGQEASIPPGAWPNFVLSNHDEHRIPSRLGPVRARAAMMLLLTLRGTPQIYYGDEIGMLDVEIPPEREQDPWGKRVKGLGLGRDPERTPMQWDASPNAGFTGAGIETWLPISPDYAALNVAVQRDDPHSMLSLTRTILALRRAEEALNHGSYTPLDVAPDRALVYLREAGESRFLVIINFTSDALTLDFPYGSGKVEVSTQMDRVGTESLSGLRVRGDEGLIIRLS